MATENSAEKTALERPQVLESVQDFLIMFGIKQLTHLLDISTFPLNNLIVRLNKIMNRADTNWAHFFSK